MKHICRILVAFLLILCCSSFLSGQEKKAVKHNLKTFTVYEQKFEKGTGGKTLKESEILYDKDGNVLEDTQFSQGKVDKHVVYQYDEDGNKIRETELDPSGKKTKVSEYKYDDGLRTEKTVYDANNKVVSKKTYKYETY
jgi:hypothetical protein